jgi:hypothetical protein
MEHDDTREGLRCDAAAGPDLAGWRWEHRPTSTAAPALGSAPCGNTARSTASSASRPPEHAPLSTDLPAPFRTSEYAP